MDGNNAIGNYFLLEKKNLVGKNFKGDFKKVLVPLCDESSHVAPYTRTRCVNA